MSEKACVICGYAPHYADWQMDRHICTPCSNGLYYEWLSVLDAAALTNRARPAMIFDHFVWSVVGSKDVTKW